MLTQLHLQYAVVDIFNTSGGSKIVQWEPSEPPPFLSKMEGLETKAGASFSNYEKHLCSISIFQRGISFLKVLLDQGPFSGASGALILDFGWLFPWVSKPGWIHCHLSFLIVCAQQSPEHFCLLGPDFEFGSLTCKVSPVPLLGPAIATQHLNRHRILLTMLHLKSITECVLW